MMGISTFIANYKILLLVQLLQLQFLEESMRQICYEPGWAERKVDCEPYWSSQIQFVGQDTHNTVFRPSLRTQAAHESKENGEELVNGGSAKIHPCVKETEEGFIQGSLTCHGS